MKKNLMMLFVALFCAMNLNAKFKIGEIYNQNGLKGMIVTLDESGEHGLLLSLEQSSADWTANKDLNLVTAAFHEDDGWKNTLAIEQYLKESGKNWESFPVFNWARSLGEGWYIPAKDELVKIWTNLNGGGLKLNKKSKKIWKELNKTIKKADGDPFFTKLSMMESGLNHVLMGMISSTECEGGKIWVINAKGVKVLMDALPSPNAPIEVTELEKNNHSETKNLLSVRRKFETRAVHKF